MTSRSGLQTGRRVSKYEILTRLSMGGMAELFLAFLPGPGGFKKFVALKQILPDIRSDESFVKMFLDEARLTAALNHSNVAQVFDLGEDPESNELYLAMEFVAGQNLEQIVKRAAKLQVPIPVGFAARVMRDVCLGLHSAHAFLEPNTGKPNPIVHRDVSPKNVMVTYTGQVKVIDFGIAKAKGRLNRTQVGMVKGTSGYMAPEQVRNEHLDGRADLFAVGVMFHELLTGERLYGGPNQSDASMMLAIVDSQPSSPRTVNPYCSESLAQLVLKTLAKKADARFSTGKELAKAIEHAVPDFFDDEQLAALMTQLFEDKIAITRALFDMANQEVADEVSMTRAVAVLVDDGGKAAKSATPAQPVAPQTATPKPRKTKSNQPTVRPSQRNLARVAPPPPPDEPSVQVAPDPTPPSAPPPVRRATRSVAAVQPTPTPTPPSDAGSGAGWLAIPVVLAILVGGVVWAVLMGPLQEPFAKLMAEPPPPDLATKRVEVVDPMADKPKWMRDAYDQAGKEKAEKARQKEIEDAANSPERKKLLEEINQQLAKLDKLEAEQQALKASTSSSGQATSTRITELEREMQALKDALKLKQAKASGPQAAVAEGEEPPVEVIKDDKKAQQASVGYLSLRTIAPANAHVVDKDGTDLGTTPITKAPLDVGLHSLRIIDGDSKTHELKVTVEAGKTLDLKGVVVDSLPLLP